MLWSVFILDSGDLTPDVFSGRVKMGSRRLAVQVLLRLVALLQGMNLVEEYVGRGKLHLSSEKI